MSIGILLPSPCVPVLPPWHARRDAGGLPGTLAVAIAALLCFVTLAVVAASLCFVALALAFAALLCFVALVAVVAAWGCGALCRQKYAQWRGGKTGHVNGHSIMDKRDIEGTGGAGSDNAGFRRGLLGLLPEGITCNEH